MPGTPTATDSVSLTLALSYAPLLYVHAPPLGTAVSVSPATGDALSSFQLTVSGFADADARVVRSVYPDTAAGGGAAAALAAIAGGLEGAGDNADATARCALSAAARRPEYAQLGLFAALLGVTPAQACQVSILGRGLANAAALPGSPIARPQIISVDFFVGGTDALLTASWAALAAPAAQLSLLNNPVGAGTPLTQPSASTSVSVKLLAGAPPTSATSTRVSAIIVDSVRGAALAWFTATLTPPTTASALAVASSIVAGSGAASAGASSVASQVSMLATTSSLLSAAVSSGTLSVTDAATVIALQSGLISNFASAVAPSTPTTLTDSHSASQYITVAPLAAAPAVGSSFVFTSIGSGIRFSSAVAPGTTYYVVTPPGGYSPTTTTFAFSATRGGPSISVSTDAVTAQAQVSIASASPSLSATEASVAAAALNSLTTSLAAGSATLSVADASSVLAAVTSIAASSSAATVTADLISTLSTIVDASAVTMPAPPAPPGMNASAVRPPVTLPVATSGLPPALQSAAVASIASLTTQMLANAGGELTRMTSAPTEATDRASTPIAPFCGSATSIAAQTLTSSSNSGAAVLPIRSPLNPCYATDASGGTRPLALSNDVIAAQPAPSVAIPNAALSQLTAASGGAVNLAVTQWGVSPFNETNGLSNLLYPALTALSDIANAAAASAAADAASVAASANGGGRRRLGDMMGSTWAAVQAAIAAVGSKTAVNSAADALLRRNPRPVTTRDLLSGRPLDSRVVSIAASTAGASGAPVDVVLKTPVEVVIPLRDPSVVRADGTVDVGNAAFLQYRVRAVCPSSPSATKVIATFVSGGAASVTIDSWTAETYSSVVGSVANEAPVSGGIASLAAPDGTSVNAATIGTNGRGNATLSSASVLTKNIVYTYVLSTDCGPALGRRTFVCGAGAATAEYACPAVVATPRCLLYNTTRQVWSNDACTVTSVAPTAVTCACTRLGAVAVRYSSQEQIQYDVFATNSLSSVVNVFGMWIGYFIVLGVASLLIIFTTFYCGSRTDRTQKYLASLEADAEIAPLIAAALAGGKAFVLDTESRVGKGAGRGGAKVLPMSAGKVVSVVAPPQSAKVVRISPSAGITAARSGDAGLTAIYTALKDAAAPVTIALNGDDVGFSARGNETGSGVGGDALVVAAIERWRRARAGAEKVENDTCLAIRRVACARCMTVPHAMLAAVWPACLPLGRVRALFHPALPSYAPPCTRILASLTSTFASGAIAAVFYAYLLSAPLKPGSIEYAALSSAQLLALGVASCVVAVPLDAAINALFNFVAARDAAWRSPALADELAARRAAALILATKSTSRLLALASRGKMIGDDEDVAALDEASVPGWVSPSPLVRKWCGGLPAACGRDPDARASAVAPRGDEETVAELAARLSASIAAARSSASRPFAGYSAVAIARDFAFAGALAISLIYGVAFVLVRGSASAAGVLNAWLFGTTLSVLLLRPIVEHARVFVVFHSAWAPRDAADADAEALCMWHDGLALPHAAAAAAGGANADVAVAALAPLRVLATAWAARREPALSLRFAALARVYAMLRSYDDTSNILTKGDQSRLTRAVPNSAGGSPREPTAASTYSDDALDVHVREGVVGGGREPTPFVDGASSPEITSRPTLFVPPPVATSTPAFYDPSTAPLQARFATNAVFSPSSAVGTAGPNSIAQSGATTHATGTRAASPATMGRRGPPPRGPLGALQPLQPLAGVGVRTLGGLGASGVAPRGLAIPLPAGRINPVPPQGALPQGARPMLGAAGRGVLGQPRGAAINVIPLRPRGALPPPRGSRV